MNDFIEFLAFYCKYATVLIINFFIWYFLNMISPFENKSVFFFGISATTLALFLSITILEIKNIFKNFKK